MELVRNLEKRFGANVPILLAEIKNLFADYSTPYIFKVIRKAIESGALVRYDDSIYFIPKETMYGDAGLNPEAVVFKKYIRDSGGAIGVYAGWEFLNSIGATTQVPNVVEVVTNKESLRLRKVQVGKQRFMLRKPKCEINSDNEKIIRIMETATRFEFNDNVSDAVVTYAKLSKISAKDLLQYAAYYPAETLKNMRRVLYVLA